jgi:hypothetical protein
MERRPLQYAAGSLAGSAFIATTQILTGVALDIPLIIALALFAAMMPFQIILFFMPVPPARTQGLSRSQTLYWFIQLWSTRLILVGFVALFWHFFWWLGILFAAAAYIAFRVYRACAYASDYEEQDSSEPPTRNTPTN